MSDLIRTKTRMLGEKMKINVVPKFKTAAGRKLKNRRYI